MGISYFEFVGILLLMAACAFGAGYALSRIDAKQIDDIASAKADFADALASTPPIPQLLRLLDWLAEKLERL